jgi:Leucine-rich repeat (LRR) protein
LEYNKFIEIPKAIRYIKNLYYLNISNNQIITIPKIINNYKWFNKNILTILNLIHNNIMYIPKLNNYTVKIENYLI